MTLAQRLQCNRREGHAVSRLLRGLTSAVRPDLPLGPLLPLARNPRTPRAALEEWLDGGTEGQRTLARAALRKRAEAAAGAAAEAVLDGAERAGARVDEARTTAADEMDDALGLEPKRTAQRSFEKWCPSCP